MDGLLGLVTDVNWLAETDHGELRLAPEVSSVHELLGAEPDRWQPQSQVRQVELSLPVSGDLPDADPDRLRMSQALGKILGSAIPCTEAGWIILIRADRENGGALVISVADDGTGIDSTDLPHGHGGTIAVASDFLDRTPLRPFTFPLASERHRARPRTPPQQRQPMQERS